MSTGTTTQPTLLRAPRLRDQRQRTLINRKYQLRASFMTTALTLSLLIPLNVGLFVARGETSRAVLDATPGLAAMLRAQDRHEALLVLLGSVLLMLIVFFVTMIVTHRTAGAAFHIARRMEDVGEGRYQARVRLRDHDNLVELEAAFNSMVSSLEDRAWRDVEALEEISALASQAETPEARTELSALLTELATQRRRLVEPSKAG